MHPKRGNSPALATLRILPRLSVAVLLVFPLLSCGGSKSDQEIEWRLTKLEERISVLETELRHVNEALERRHVQESGRGGSGAKQQPERPQKLQSSTDLVTLCKQLENSSGPPAAPGGPLYGKDPAEMVEILKNCLNLKQKGLLR
jgi:hypothetical protein